MFLAKFVKESKYADCFMNGSLYMHTGFYYHDEEKWKESQEGKSKLQGDIGEGRIFSGLGIHKNIHLPIFCMSIFEEKDIIDSKIKIDEQIIKDFDCSYGYMVLVDYEPFIERIQELDRKGHQIAYKKVKYGSPSMELSLQLLSQKTVENLFIKRSEYEHQKEFRIVVIEDYTDEEYSLREEGENFSKTYNLSSDLHDIARKIDISSLDAEEGYRIFHIPEKV